MTCHKISLMVSDGIERLLTEADFCKSFLDRIQALGIDGVEVMLVENDGCYCDTDGLAQLSQEMLNRGMSIPCVDLYIDFLEPGRFAEKCEILDRMIAGAAALGTSLAMVCGSQLPDGMEPSQGRELVAKGVDKAIESGKRKNIDIAIESFGVSYDLQSTASMLSEIYSGLKETPCYFVGDLANPCYGGEAPVVSIQEFRNKLRHVHVKDVKQSEGNEGVVASDGNRLTQAELGKGIADVMSSLRSLREQKYCGWYSLEVIDVGDMIALGQYLSVLKELLQVD